MNVHYPIMCDFQLLTEPGDKPFVLGVRRFTQGDYGAVTRMIVSQSCEDKHGLLDVEASPRMLRKLAAWAASAADAVERHAVDTAERRTADARERLLHASEKLAQSGGPNWASDFLPTDTIEN